MRMLYGSHTCIIWNREPWNFFWMPHYQHKPTSVSGGKPRLINVSCARQEKLSNCNVSLESICGGTFSNLLTLPSTQCTPTCLGTQWGVGQFLLNCASQLKIRHCQPGQKEQKNLLTVPVAYNIDASPLEKSNKYAHFLNEMSDNYDCSVTALTDVQWTTSSPPTISWHVT